MTLDVHLDESDAVVLRQKAQALGQDLSAYVGAILHREARRPLRTVQQIADDIEQRCGEPLNMSENEISEMLETAKHEMRAERRRKAGQ
jgi:hypothetical protein